LLIKDDGFCWVVVGVGCEGEWNSVNFFFFVTFLSIGLLSAVVGRLNWGGGMATFFENLVLAKISVAKRKAKLIAYSQARITGYCYQSHHHYP